MQIEAKKVVSIAYTLKDDAGEVLDQSDEKEPFAYIQGTESMIPGLEKALEGKSAGDALEVTVAPEEAYGHRDEGLVQNIPVRKLPDKKPVVGRRYPVQTTEGPRLLLVTALRGDYATVDGNHPLVGKTLHFSVKIVEVRDATAEELQHGHVHAPGGHHH